MTDVPAPLPIDDDAISHYKVCLYGQSGMGKSAGACSAPGPIAVLSADRPGAYQYAKSVHGADKVRVTRLAKLGRPRAALKTFLQAMHSDEDIRTVVIDPLGEIHSAVLREVGGISPQIQHYGTANTEVESFIRELRDLDVHVVIVCHEQIDDSEDGGATRRPLTGGKKLPETVMGMVDFVSYCSVLPPETEGGDDRYVGQLVPGKGRRAKAPCPLGAYRLVNLQEWFEVADAYFGQDTSDVPWSEDYVPDAEPQTTLDGEVA